MTTTEAAGGVFAVVAGRHDGGVVGWAVEAEEVRGGGVYAVAGWVSWTAHEFLCETMAELGLPEAGPRLGLLRRR